MATKREMTLQLLREAGLREPQLEIAEGWFKRLPADSHSDLYKLFHAVQAEGMRRTTLVGNTEGRFRELRDLFSALDRPVNLYAGPARIPKSLHTPLVSYLADQSKVLISKKGFVRGLTALLDFVAPHLARHGRPESLRDILGALHGEGRDHLKVAERLVGEWREHPHYPLYLLCAARLDELGVPLSRWQEKQDLGKNPYYATIDLLTEEYGRHPKQSENLLWELQQLLHHRSKFLQHYPERPEEERR